MSISAENNFDKLLIDLNNQEQGELLDIIGAYALSEEPDVLQETLAINRKLDIQSLRQSAQKYLKKIEPVVKEVICGSDGLLNYLDQPTVKDILTVILPALGFQVGGVIPTAVIAISIIIFRAGIREYCKDGYFVLGEVR